MNLLEKIQMLAAQKGTTLAALDRECNFAHGTIRRWGSVSPSIDKVCSVAVKLQVSVDYLCGVTDSAKELSFVPPDSHSFDITPDEKKMIIAYRLLSVSRQENVRNYLDDQSKLNKTESKKGKNIV